MQVNYNFDKYKGKNGIGKWFEKEVVEKALAELERHHCCFQHRFVDSAEARNMVRGQPADYLLATQNEVYLIEAKATITGKNLQKSDMQPAQVAGMIRWGRAGHNSLILQYRKEDNRIHCYDGWKAADLISNGGSLSVANNGSCGPEALASALLNYDFK